MRTGTAALLTALVFALVAPPAAPAATPQPRATAAAAPAATTDPFDGIGTWVSIFMDTWDHPRHHVRQMHREGVTTLYLQTSSSRTPEHRNVFRPRRVAAFIEAAHAHGMKVVAWYLPPLADIPAEYERAMAAVKFRTDSGQRFDGFALDIEPTARTPDVPKRNENLLRLGRKIRRSAPVGYPMGAIIPSPVGLRRSPEFWPDFPYEDLRPLYDVVLPMSYHTYRVQGAADTYEYTRKNIAIIRRRVGADTRIHMIGGEAQASNAWESRAFLRAVNDAGVTGASLWHYGTHGPEDWDALRRLAGTAQTRSTPRAATAFPPVDPLHAYRGLATWIDIYDELTWDQPVASIRRMHRKGVRTLYLETANYRIDTPIFRPDVAGTMIEAAHAHGIKVVAWYLPSYANLRKDYRRSMAAIRFTSRNGHRFDGFAQDIEATVVRDIDTRNRRVRTLTRRIRERVGPDYTMGAIVPEAGALYWPRFPYRYVARHYDVFLPMAYYTFRTSGAAGVRTWMTRNIRAIREETGSPDVPIHPIGGLSKDTTLPELRAFVNTVLEHGVIGASIYEFETTTNRQWEKLARIQM